MSKTHALPGLLIIDDLYGRTYPGDRNEDRANICGQLLIKDITGDDKGNPQKISNPVAQAVFCRGQTPAYATVGDNVENDLEGTLRVIREGWISPPKGRPRWAMILLDLCFHTGRVTEESNCRAPGVPEGRDGDNDPEQYFGLRILEAIHHEFPDLPVIIFSSQEREQVSRKFAYLGALGFLRRNDPNGLKTLQDYLWRHGLLADDTGEIIGQSTAILLALRTARRAATDHRNILIRGERGTGKELLARYIHRQSMAHRTGPLVIVDSGALNPQLYASELFGHRRGAFTGADHDREGRILQAHAGDLFLDEIGNMPLDVQVGLLRVLEHREVAPLGAAQGQRVDVRFLSATNEDIEGKAAIGGFRRDLLDRLRDGGMIFMPPLRHRLEDISLLVEKFVQDAVRETPGAMKRTIDAEAFDKLISYHWLGNVRAFRSCIYNAVKNHPDVEHLVPVHIQFPSDQEALSQSVPVAPPPPPPESSTHQVNDFDALIGALSSFTFDTLKPVDLKGKLSKLELEYTHCMARYLKAALAATGKPTLQNPEGEILIHPAMKWITGDAKLTASKAADIIKRLLGPLADTHDPLLSDRILKEAYEIALRLRPRQQKPKNGGDAKK